MDAESVGRLGEREQRQLITVYPALAVGLQVLAGVCELFSWQLLR
ncbi:MAG: hypothetical protein AAFY46_08675 [Planctomycetota bacterium]